MQEEGHQDLLKWKCLKGLMGCPRQAIANLVKQSEPSKEETGGLKMGKSPLPGSLCFPLSMLLPPFFQLLLPPQVLFLGFLLKQFVSADVSLCQENVIALICFLF